MNQKPNSRYSNWGNEEQAKKPEALDQVCQQLADTGLERLKLIKSRLLELFLLLQRGDVSASDAKEQSLQLQDSLSELIWTLDDWEIQSDSRN